MNFSVLVVLLTRALLAEVCDALNVTVTPGPIVMVTEGDNLTLSCLVSQKKRSSSFLVLRWLFSSPPPLPPPVIPPSPSPPPSASPPPPEQLIVKLTMKRAKMYGNYTRRFAQTKFRLYEEREGEEYGLVVLNATRLDRGRYTCRVQEIRKHRNTWKASSNGTATTQLTVHFTPENGSSEGVLRLFEDVYLYAVLICSLGLLSIFLFTLVLTCQHLHTTHRLKASSYYLVKCPESSSGETVTSSMSSSSSSPGGHRKETRLKPERRSTPAPPRGLEEAPPHLPAKVPVASQKPRKPRRLKSQPRRPVTRVTEEDSLTYAELELVRPKPALDLPPPPPSPPSSSSSSCLHPTDSSTDTVYAQILFQEKQL